MTTARVEVNDTRTTGSYTAGAIAQVKPEAAEAPVRPERTLFGVGDSGDAGGGHATVTCGAVGNGVGDDTTTCIDGTTCGNTIVQLVNVKLGVVKGVRTASRQMGRNQLLRRNKVE